MSELLVRNDCEDDGDYDEDYENDIVSELNNNIDTVNDISKYNIVIYNNKLLILLPVSSYEEYQAFWGVDYYAYRTQMLLEKKCDAIKCSNDFLMDRSSRELTYKGESSVITNENKKKNYQHYVTNVEYVKDKSCDNLDKIHYELLRKRVLRKYLNVPTKDEILKRELEHRNKIRVEIDKVLRDLPTLLYECADKGLVDFCVNFRNVSERYITVYGALPRIERHPCGDGKVRETFEDYLYYLFEDLYHKHIDEGDDPHMWVGARVVEQLKKIYPHLSMSCESSTPEMFVPRIKITFDVDLSAFGVIK
jgi:hypothetical protein